MNSLPTGPISRRSSTAQWIFTTSSIVILVASVVLAYSNSLSGPFVFDDIPTIVDSPSIRSLWPPQRVLFQGDTSALGRPLLNLSFALNYACTGLAVAPFHIVNVALHLVAGIVLMGVVIRTLRAFPSSNPLRSHANLISLFCALIWLLHPLQTESVTYVTQRAESLVGLFYLLTLYCAIRARASRHASCWQAAAFISCLFGVASKEVIVSAPLAVVMYDCTFPGRNRKQLLFQRRWLYALLLSTWIPLSLLVSQGRQDSAGFGYGLSSWEYLFIQFGAITRYLQLSIWPDALVLDYGVGAIRSPAETLPAAILVGLLVVASVVAIKYQPWIAFLGFVFFAAISPSSSVIPIVTQTAAEHRMYLPLAPIIIIAVVAIWQGCGSTTKTWRPATRSVAYGRVLPTSILTLITICCGSLTFARNLEYADAIRLWKTNIQRWPDSLRPYMLIGSEYIEKKHDAATALIWYDRAIASYDLVKSRNKRTKHVDLQLAGVYFGRGTAYSHLRRFEDSLADFDRTIELNPAIVNAYFYRGMALGLLDRNNEAIASLTKALDLEVSPERLFIRGEVFGKEQRFSEAISDLSIASKMDPTNPRIFQSRAHCLIGIGRYQDALRDLSEALKLYPDFVKALNSRGIAYGALDRHLDAIHDLSQAITLAPEFADAYRNRAKSFQALGRTEDARRDIQSFESLSGHPVPPK